MGMKTEKLRKKLGHYLLLAGLLLSGLRPAQAQNAAAACGSGRYINDQFANAQPTTVLFGQNYSHNYASGSNTFVSLYLDVYEPANDRVGDLTAQRPLIILAFGGAFITGSRTDADIVAICQAFARKGYVTAAIDYRLIENDFANQYYVSQNQQYLIDEVIRAASDMKAAVRYFKRDAATAKTFRIDPTKIFVGGFSAGAITALQVGYTDAITENPITTNAYIANGGLEGNTDLTPPLQPTYNAEGIAGVFNIAGAVSRTRILNTGNPPLYSAQGTSDQIVPYNEGTIQGTMFTLSGSYRLKQRADSVGIVNQLHPVVNGDHGSPANDPDRSQIIAEAATFLQAIICPATPLPVVLSSFTGQADPATCAATLAWQTAAETNSRAYEVQASADGRTFARLGTVPSRNQLTGAAYTYRVGPLAGPRYFRLRLLDADGTFTYSPVLALAATCVGSEGISAAPNPVQDVLTVRGLAAGPARLLLYDATGRLLLQASTTEATATLAVGGLPAGIYFLKIRSEAGAALGSLKVEKF